MERTYNEHQRGPTVLTIGHSTHLFDEFLALLQRHGIELLLDIRRFPGSSRVPQFNKSVLETRLAAAGISYEHMPELGGRRRPSVHSVNSGWNQEGFRGYADYMQTSVFAEALSRLIEPALRRRAAYMCAEGLWWRCHRRLVSDALHVRGWQVVHIMPDGETAIHELTSFAEIVGEAVSYPSARRTG